MKEFNFLCGTKIRFSTDFSTAIKACRDEIECTKAFIVTDPILYELPIYQEFLTAIKQAGLKYEEYHNVRVNPTDVVIMDCASALRKSDCDIVEEVPSTPLRVPLSFIPIPVISATITA